MRPTIVVEDFLSFGVGYCWFGGGAGVCLLGGDGGLRFFGTVGTGHSDSEWEGSR